MPCARRDVVIRPASLVDAGQLGELGPAAYRAAYDYLWDHPAALAEQLATFNEAAFRALLQRPEVRVWVAEHAGVVLGFLSLICASPSPASGRAGGAEIARVYLLPELCGQGVGRQLLAEASAFAQEQNLRYLWLDVMASASGAIGTYQHWGFVETGRKQFARPVRAGMAEMVVLERELDFSPA